MVLLPSLKIGKHIARYPIIQGAMARVSGPRLASAVANAGGIGLISTFGIGLNPGEHRLQSSRKRIFEANQTALIDALKSARQRSPYGIIGVNVLVATRDYRSLAITAADQGADLIVTAAGLPLDLPDYLSDYPDVALVPIVANVDAAKQLCETWLSQYNRLPDAFIVENCKLIGGHFASQCEEGTNATIGMAIAQLKHHLNHDLKVDIPVIVTGGIWDRADIDAMMAISADGVQIGTRFITTRECDAAPRYKEFFCQANDKDLVTVPSPVGKPARAIRNPFIEDVFSQSPTVEKRCVANCLESCLCRDHGKMYCLIQALTRAAEGDIEQGLIFSSGAFKPVEEIISVAELMTVLTQPIGISHPV